MTCLPDHGPHYARGLCRRCYDRERYRGLVGGHVRRRVDVAGLVSRAERLRAELEAAGPYAAIPCTWPAIARHLGVKPESLERARTRAKQRSAA